MNSLNCTKEVLQALYSANIFAQIHHSSEICIQHLYNGVLTTPTIMNLLDYYAPHISFYFKNQIKVSTKICNTINSLPLDLLTLNILLNLQKTKKIFNTFDLLESILNLNTIKLKYKEEIINNFNILFQPVFNKSTQLLTSILTLLAKNITTTHIDVSAYLEKKIELTQLSEILERPIKNNPIICGTIGSGKKTIIKELLTCLQKENIKLFTEIWIFNPYLLCENKEKLELLFKGLLYNLKTTKEKILFIIPDIHLLLQLDPKDTQQSQLENQNSFNNIIRCLLKFSSFQILATTTPENYTKIETIFKDENLFEEVNVKPLTKFEQLQLLNNIKKTKEEKYNSTIKISQSNLDEIITLGNKYLTPITPQKLLIFLELSLNKAIAPNLTSENLQSVIIQLSNIPETVFRKKSETTNTLINLEKILKKKVFGQDKTITQITNVILRTNLGLKQLNKPLGSWLFCGFSGTGKTELAKALAESLFDSKSNMLRFDMSEFMEKHTVARLIGSPPGYVGYGEGGQLTTAVKKQPHTLILFDEIEKAHPDITNILLQVLDDGRLTDSTGEIVNFTNTLIIFTSNLGCPKISTEFPSFALGTEFTSIEYELLTKKVNSAVKSFFKPEFLNRLDDIIVFKPLEIKYLTFICKKFLTELQENLKQKHIPLYLDIPTSVCFLISTLAYQPLYGARPLKRLMEKFIEKPLSDILLHTELTTDHIFSISFDKKTNKFQYLLVKK